MEDSAITAINALRASRVRLSFDWLRRSFGEQKSDETYRSLNYGRAIISDEDQLNQYLYSYGPMIESQWSIAAGFLETAAVPSGVRWIDYGCGQGLAGLFISEQISCDLLENVRVTVLIEPSGPALGRAEAIYRSITPNAEIFVVQKGFDEVKETDLRNQGVANTVHVFSNVLDIGGYDRLSLLGKALSPGPHSIIAVGHDRDHHGGSQGIMTLKSAVEHPSMASRISVRTSVVEKFDCSNRGEPAIAWHCELDVTHE